MSCYHLVIHRWLTPNGLCKCQTAPCDITVAPVKLYLPTTGTQVCGSRSEFRKDSPLSYTNRQLSAGAMPHLTVPVTAFVLDYAPIIYTSLSFVNPFLKNFLTFCIKICGSAIKMQKGRANPPYILLCQCVCLGQTQKAGQRALDALSIHAIGDADVAAHAEIIAGDD